jgi:ketosteroid isomerase-like protein
VGADDLFGQLPSQPCWVGVGSCRASCERPVDENQELVGGRGRLLMVELDEFILEELVDSFAILAGDVVRRMVRILVADDCVMEAVQPAPDGARYEGREACLTFWQALTGDRSTQFEAEDIVVSGEHATIRWRYHFGDAPADSVRGVNLMRVRDGQIVEALGYSKTGGEIPLAADASVDS